MPTKTMRSTCGTITVFLRVVAITYLKWFANYLRTALSVSRNRIQNVENCWSNSSVNILIRKCVYIYIYMYIYICIYIYVYIYMYIYIIYIYNVYIYMYICMHV